uniref:Uncharacterized protein n=1 Tax=Anopheles maculatus TaxID=74869 RepID=A0A182SNK4_9DIPT
IYDRIKQIKDALIGGERANDIQLKEKRYRNKLASEKRINALAQALGRIEQTADRDLLQGHCSDIQQELKVRYEQIRALRKRTKFLEQEVSDIQGEFQRERDDYLATIRLLEKKVLFYETVFQKAMPVLRKDGRYWNLECLEKESEWSDDLRKWRLPDDTLSTSHPLGMSMLAIGNFVFCKSSIIGLNESRTGGLKLNPNNASTIRPNSRSTHAASGQSAVTAMPIHSA